MKAIEPWEEDQAFDREDTLDHGRSKRYQQWAFCLPTKSLTQSCRLGFSRSSKTKGGVLNSVPTPVFTTA